MKFSEQSLTVLKNFASINTGLVLQKGTVQRTISPEQTILAVAHLPDTVDEVFGIYDLNQFLGNVTTLKTPEMSFTKEQVIMNDGEMSLSYYSCSPALIVSPPADKTIELKKVDVTFTLANSTLTKLLRLATMNNLTHLTVIGKDGELRLLSHEQKNDSSNKVSTKIDDYTGPDFSVSFKTENLKMIPDEYKVELMLGGFAKFTNKAETLTYFIAMEKEQK